MGDRRARDKGEREEKGDDKLGPPRKRRKMAEEEEVTPLVLAFQQYAKSLTALHEQRERLIKASRDLTNAGKKFVFLLHRTPNSAEGMEEARKAMVSMQQKELRRLAEALKGKPYYEFHRSFSPGFQEYIEGVAFYKFKKSFVEYTEREDEKIPDDFAPFILTYEELCDLQEQAGVQIKVDYLDYLLGLADTTGECMRLCIGLSAKVNSVDVHACQFICAFMRELYRTFVALPSPSKGELRKKVATLTNSVLKCENALCTMDLRIVEQAQIETNS